MNLSVRFYVWFVEPETVETKLQLEEGTLHMRRYPGIRIHSIPAEGGAGLIFAVGTLVIFLAGVPATRLVLAAGLVGGLMVAAILRWTDRTR